MARRSWGIRCRHKSGSNSAGQFSLSSRCPARQSTLGWRHSPRPLSLHLNLPLYAWLYPRLWLPHHHCNNFNICLVLPLTRSLDHKPGGELRWVVVQSPPLKPLLPVLRFQKRSPTGVADVKALDQYGLETDSPNDRSRSGTVHWIPTSSTNRVCDTPP